MCTFPSSTNNFAHAQTHPQRGSLSGRMNIARVNMECFTGCKRIKQRRISFVLGYLRMILWSIPTAISIKHRILATFNLNKNSILTDCMPLKRLIWKYQMGNQKSLFKEKGHTGKLVDKIIHYRISQENVWFERIVTTWKERHTVRLTDWLLDDWLNGSNIVAL